MSGVSLARLGFKDRANLYGPSSAQLSCGRRRVTPLDLNSFDFIRGVADALKEDFGDSPSTVKTICEATGAAPGTVKKWLAQDNGPGGEMLMKLMFASGAVRRYVDTTLQREDMLAKREQQMRRALALFEGREDP